MGPMPHPAPIPQYTPPPPPNKSSNKITIRTISIFFSLIASNRKYAYEEIAHGPLELLSAK